MRISIWNINQCTVEQPSQLSEKPFTSELIFDYLDRQLLLHLWKTYTKPYDVRYKKLRNKNSNLCYSTTYCMVVKTNKYTIN